MRRTKEYIAPERTKGYFKSTLYKLNSNIVTSFHGPSSTQNSTNARNNGKVFYVRQNFFVMVNEKKKTKLKIFCI